MRGSGPGVRVGPGVGDGLGLGRGVGAGPGSGVGVGEGMGSGVGGAGGTANVRVTGVPRATEALAAGSWDCTVPAPVSGAATRPAFSSSTLASAKGRPATA